MVSQSMDLVADVGDLGEVILVIADLFDAVEALTVPVPLALQAIGGL